VYRLTVPLNPFRLVTTIIDVPEEPAGIVRLFGLAVIEKSDVEPDWTMVKATLTECDRLPLVPVTLTTQVLAGLPA